MNFKKRREKRGRIIIIKKMTFESHYLSSINMPCLIESSCRVTFNTVKKSNVWTSEEVTCITRARRLPSDTGALACVLRMLVKSLLPVNFMPPYYFSFDFDILSFNCVTSTKFYFILIN